MYNKKEETSKIKKLVDSQKTKDSYILDDENAIIVIKNNNRSTLNEYGYRMIHQRLKNGKLIEINSWYLDVYYFGISKEVVLIKDLNLFKVQKNHRYFDALYDYKNGGFLVSKGIWDSINSGVNNKILTKYNGFHATFSISSDFEGGDIFSYINAITNERIIKKFDVQDGTYHALLNIDGTIRGNKLFKGSALSRIEEIIDLDQYESLEAFKQERKQICNAEKQRQKQEYQKMIASRNDGNISPYLDSEVAKILSLKK